MHDTVPPGNISSCDREPIHTPGSIQPHGMMLVVTRDGLLVRHVAGDIEHRLGAVAWQDQELALLVGGALNAEIRRLIGSEARGGFAGQLETAAGELLDVTVPSGDSYVIVELEAASANGWPASRVVERLATAAAGFELAASLTALCERAAVEFRRLTGFDRVMVYCFLDEGAGKVLAEDRLIGLPSFLNHHFPASDIPRQARALYLRNLVRAIPDVSYQPVALRPEWAAAAPLDMSDSGLRSVSPIHLQYLANMNVQASASFSIVKDGVLWGLVACHNQTPRHLTYDVRIAGRSLAATLARQVKAKDEAEGYRQRIRLRSFEDDIVVLLAREGPLGEALSNRLDEIGRMMEAHGVAVLRGHELVMSGTCPENAEVRDLAAWLLERTREPIFATDELAKSYLPAATFQRSGSGLLSVTLSADEPWLLLWFRVEQIETVNWAGNPHKPDDAESGKPLTPRASFEAWAETVRGRARAWSLPEVDAAARLRTKLLELQQNRRVLDLNRQLTKILQDKDQLLQQKEFLIGEVNHRVQNSLMIVASFLGLQSRSSHDQELQAALEEARRRLTAVALVHRRLYRGDQIEIVNAARYIEELCADTFLFMGSDWAHHFTLSLAPVLVTTDQAVTLGLIITELLINSNKHAYGGAAGPIEIELIDDRTQFQIVVSDKGSGSQAVQGGFGSRIVDSLVKQIGGELTQRSNHPGLRVVVTVPRKNAPAPG